MKYGINNWVYAGEPMRDTFARLARYGYDGVELKGEWSDGSAAEIIALKKEFGLEVLSLLGWCMSGIPGRDLSSSDPAEREAALGYMRRCTDFAAETGASVLLVLPFAAGRTAPVGRPDTEEGWLAASKQEWDSAVDSVRQLAAYAAKQKITLVIEPINRFETYQIITVDDAIRFIADVGAENVKINLDVFHMNIDEPDLVAAVRKAGPLLGHMHMADSNRLPPGQGHADLPAIMAALHEIHFNGSIVLEAVPPGADPGLAIKMTKNLPLRDRYAEESIRYLKQIESALAAA